MSGMGRVVLSSLLVSCATLSACAVPVITLFSDTDSGLDLAPGESTNIHFFTNQANYDTGIRLASGQTYELDITLLSYWIDSTIELNENEEPLDETGFDNSVMPISWLGMTRRSREHRWFELMLYQANCGRESLRGVSDLGKDDSGPVYRYIASCDGNLRLFVNDSPGFYSNNAGYANISLTRVD